MSCICRFLEGDGQNTVEAFRQLLSTRANDIAAFICEPLVLGAGGMLMYEASVLKALYNLCSDYGVFFIADEVMTGWGRTGTRFACEQAGIVPDILCLSKGLTGGYLPLAVTLCSGDIYRAFIPKTAPRRSSILPPTRAMRLRVPRRWRL